MINEQANTLPKDVILEASRYFYDNLIGQAARLLRESRVAISFRHGRNPSSFFVVSGIVTEDRAHEAKITYKKRLEETEEGPIASNCDCRQWNPEHHCAHAIALFLYFKMEEGQGTTSEPHLDDSPPMAINTSFGVTPTEYGTYVANPHQLEGAPPAATYNSLQYLLSNRKVINFPIPEHFQGKLVVFIEPPKLGPLSEEFLHELPPEKQLDFYSQTFFGWRAPDGTLHKKVNIFESLYLFNWQTGEAFHLNQPLKDFVQKVHIYRHSLNANDVIRLAFGEAQENLEVQIQGKLLTELPEEKPHCQINLTPGDRKGHLRVECFFLDSNDHLMPIPEILSAFSFEGGRLSTFRKKRDAYDFIENILNHEKNQDEAYKRNLLGVSDRKRWLEILSELFADHKSRLYDPRSQSLVYYDNDTIKKLFIALIQHFGPSFFRFSEFDKAERKLRFNVSANAIFEGLSTFYQEMSLFGIQIYYDRQEIGNWRSRVRFERRSSATKWFDLELNVPEEDLEVINKANLDTGLAVTKQGLVLLNKEQKDLLRFMKRYTEYEGIEDEENQEESETKEKKFILPFNRARIFELFELRKLGIEGALTPDEIKLCERLMNLEEVPKYEIPHKLDGVIRPYQETGYHWIRFLHENKLGACLADDMGLGKTLQAIAFIQSQIENFERVLIVCPVSILLNWEHEFKKFSDIDIHIYHGGDRSFDHNKKVILTSYGVMKREIDETFADKHFDVLVLDEVQHLKNIRSLGAYAARRLQADFRICLTGTPVENDLAEFYNILDLSIPGIWGDIQLIRTTSTKKSRFLARKTARPFILRRTKDQVLTDLPPKIENNVFLDMSEEERSRYTQTLRSIKAQIQNSESRRKYGEILKGLLNLRQLCLWQTHDGGKAQSMHSVRSTKIEFLMEQLEQILEEGHQAIIFSQFTTYLDVMQKFIQERHWKYSRIDGGQSIKKRQKAVDQFQSGQNPLFLISLKAGGVGLNLTAASYVFIMDPWWNPAVEQQAIDRAHRIGQENRLTVYRPLISGSVEEKVLELQRMKKELFTDLLPENNEESLFSGKLTMKDFEHLFN